MSDTADLIESLVNTLDRLDKHMTKQDELINHIRDDKTWKLFLTVVISGVGIGIVLLICEPLLNYVNGFASLFKQSPYVLSLTVVISSVVSCAIYHFVSNWWRERKGGYGKY